MVQIKKRCNVWRLVKRVTAAKDSSTLQNCAIERNREPTLWRTDRTLMNLKKMRPIIIFPLIFWLHQKWYNWENIKMWPRSKVGDGHWNMTDAEFLKFWQQAAEPKLEEEATGIATYDKHKMHYLGAFSSKVLCENKLIGSKTAVVKVDWNLFCWAMIFLRAVKESVDRCLDTAEMINWRQLKVFVPP